MALLDLNLLPEEGDGENSLQLNKEVHDVASIHEDDQVGGAIQDGGNHVHLPSNLHFDASEQQEGMQPDGDHAFEQVSNVNGGPNSGVLPFDLNFDAYEEHLQMNSDDDHDLENNLQGLEDAVHEYGVYAGDVHIVFEEEELDDSDYEVEHTVSNDSDNEVELRNKNLTDTQRKDIYVALVGKSVCGKLRKNSTSEVAVMFNVKRARVQAIWRRAKKCRAEGIPVDVSSKKKNCGRKKVAIDLSQVADVPWHQRGDIRTLAQIIGVAKSTLHRRLHEGLLRRHTNTLKPYLKEANKKARLQWTVCMLDPHTLPNDPKFVDMRNIVHIDEKWFNTTKKTMNIYLLPTEDEPYRPVQNKNSIDKVMFLSAVARPRYNEEGICTFDGKIGVWPFTRKEPAQRSSHNRPRGTLVTKTIKVDRDTMRSYLIAKVVPAIIACWPREDANKTIWIQQDNAPAHVPVDDPQFALAVAQTGYDIRLMCQPPNSPDMNALDLGFFASLQSLTHRRVSRNIDELIDNVQQEYEDYNDSKLNRVFLTLQACLLEVMKAQGGNRYKIPHMSKARLELLGILPNTLSCDHQLYHNTRETLRNW